MGTSYGNIPIVTSGLTFCVDAANLKSYPTTGTTWTNLTKNGNNGTLVNMGTTGFSYSNLGSLVFDGVDDYVLLPSSILSNSYTIYSWIYMNGNRFVIFSNFNDDVNVKSNQFGTDGSRNVYFQISLNNNTYFYTTSTTTLNIGQWYSICFTRNGLTAKIYVNGIEIPITVVGSSTLDLQTYNSNYVIGVNRSLNYTNGRMSNTSIYDRALSSSEVLQNYNATKWRFQ